MTDVAAIAIGGGLIRAAIVHDDGGHQFVRSRAVPAELEGRLGQVLAELVDELAEEAGCRPAAIGLAVPGLVDETRGFGVFAPHLGWRAIDLRRPVVEATGLPVALGHDVRAALLAETWLGSAGGASDAAYVPIGAEISAALLVDGRVPVAGGFAGEVGHVVVAPGGLPCTCGGRGCLATVASATAIARSYAERSRSRRGSAGDRPVTAAEVAELMADGDPIAVAVWGAAVDQLARALATMAMTSGAQLIVIGGELAKTGDLLLRPLQAAVTTYGGALRPLRVALAALGDRAACLGAGLLALRLIGCAERNDRGDRAEGAAPSLTGAERLLVAARRA